MGDNEELKKVKTYFKTAPFFSKDKETMAMHASTGKEANGSLSHHHRTVILKFQFVILMNPPVILKFQFVILMNPQCFHMKRKQRHCYRMTMKKLMSMSLLQLMYIDHHHKQSGFSTTGIV